MNISPSPKTALRISVLSLLSYFLFFESMKTWGEYPDGVLGAVYQPVGIFWLLPGPASETAMALMSALWPVFLLAGIFFRFSKVSFLIAFVMGCYLLGFEYNYGRVFHGNSLALQVLWTLAVVFPLGKRAMRMTQGQAYFILRCAQFVICLGYFSTGIMKLVRSGFRWAFSENLAFIIYQQPKLSPLHDWLLDLPSFALQGVAAGALILELASLAPWFFPRLRWIFVVSWGLLHLGVFFTLGGHSTFFSHFALFPFFLAALGPHRGPNASTVIKADASAVGGLRSVPCGRNRFLKKRML
jgi:hypothetical protein